MSTPRASLKERIDYCLSHTVARHHDGCRCYQCDSASILMDVLTLLDAEPEQGWQEVRAILQAPDHRCPEIGADTLTGAFVAGAKWWEFESTGGTMWASDRDKAWAEAEKRYPAHPRPSSPAAEEK